jgi:hypothetical protein
MPRLHAPVLLLLAVAACDAATGSGAVCRDGACPCESDAACGPGAVCRDGACRCESDAACAEGQVCNRAGLCQEPPPCRANRDCPDGARCDGRTGQCAAAGRCPRDLHCPLGEVCRDGACVPGCRADADCPLGRVCREPTPLGRCEVGCRDTAGCRVGEACVAGRCRQDLFPGLCAPCGRPEDCRFRGDWCLENRGYDPERPVTGSPRFCAADCTETPDSCPAGYACRPVVARVRPPCTEDAACGAGRRCLREEEEPVGLCTCAADADCTERLAPRCVLGFCEAPAGRTCATAADCASVEACGPHGPGGARVCYLDRARPCESGADCQCLGGACVLSGRDCRDDADCRVSCVGGGCVVGRGCAPLEGLFCPRLRGG